MSCWSWSSLGIILFGILAAYRHNTNTNIKFSEFSIAPASTLTDKSVPTRRITDYEFILRDRIKGIESVDIVNGVLYGVDQNCEVIKIEGSKITQRFPLIKDRKCEGCCTPLGIRHWHDGKFVLVDGSLGAIVVDYSDETVEHVYPAVNLLGKHTGMFADDFTFIDNETIIFSDMASSCPIGKFEACFYGGVRDSRLVQLNLRTRKAEVLIDEQFGFNGVQIHTDKQSVLVAQSLLSRVVRVYFAGPKRGKTEVFAENLPGLPDNIRLSKAKDTFWVAFFMSRAPSSRIVAQHLGPYPTLRQWFYTISQLIYPPLFETILTLGSTSHHIYVELDTSGKVVSTLHDTDGRFPGTTQITDDGSHLYLSSIFQNYLVKVKKSK